MCKKVLLQQYNFTISKIICAITAGVYEKRFLSHPAIKFNYESMLERNESMKDTM